jgi:hypothetical protein
MPNDDNGRTHTDTRPGLHEYAAVKARSLDMANTAARLEGACRFRLCGQNSSGPHARREETQQRTQESDSDSQARQYTAVPAHKPYGEQERRAGVGEAAK